MRALPSIVNFIGLSDHLLRKTSRDNTCPVVEIFAHNTRQQSVLGDIIISMKIASDKIKISHFINKSAMLRFETRKTK